MGREDLANCSYKQVQRNDNLGGQIFISCNHDYFIKYFFLFINVLK